MIHRDVKPENVLIDRSGRVRIADFGLAKLAEAGLRASLTVTGAGMGTPLYMAPEQLAGAAEIDARAGIYSVGVLLYELLTGRLPVGRFPPSSKAGAGTSRFDDLVLRTLQHDPAARPASIAEVRDRLGGRALPTARRPSPREAAPAALPATANPDRDKRRQSVIAFAGIVAFAAGFMPWVVLSGWHRQMTASAWTTNLSGLPNWFVAIDGIALGLLAALAAILGRRIVSPGTTLFAALYGALHALVFAFVTAGSGEVEPNAGAILSVLAHGAIATTAFLMWREPARTAPRALGRK